MLLEWICIPIQASSNGANLREVVVKDVVTLFPVEADELYRIKHWRRESKLLFATGLFKRVQFSEWWTPWRKIVDRCD